MRTVRPTAPRRGVRAGAISWLGCVMALQAGEAAAQRADENAVRSAEDAFGLSLGNERLGLYTEDNVRGFSPGASGNLRLDGLYFDRRGPVSTRLIRGSTIRVGLTALGYDFPAPSGVVDYAIRKPGHRRLLSVAADVDSYGRANLEFDADLPLSPTLTLGVGALRTHDEKGYGGSRDVVGSAVRALWTPSPQVSLLAFATFGRTFNEDTNPLVLISRPELPAELPRRRLLGQDWADTTITAETDGVIGRFDLGDELVVRGGLFRSAQARPDSYSDLMILNAAAGPAQRSITKFPRQEFTSISGELRVTRTLHEGPRHHALVASFRGRSRDTLSGGGAAVGFGALPYGVALGLTEPVFRLGVQTKDHVVQRTFGLGYQGVWPRVGEMNAGLQRTSYERRVTPPLGAPAESDDQLWLWNANAALYVRPWLSVFAAYTRGLEDAGTAPDSARNANSALPATQTRQGEAGFRAQFGSTRVVGAAFLISKPNYAIDAANVFAPLGDIESKGVEISVIAQPLKGLRLVGGGVFSRPRVEGIAGAPGGGLKPIGAAEQILRLSADYSPPRAPAWSFDGAIAHTGERAARTDNLSSVPARTALDLGARYRFTAGETRATARIAVYNVFDSYGWGLTTGGAFFYEDPRRVVLSLIADF